jgi:hypothetical protein
MTSDHVTSSRLEAPRLLLAAALAALACEGRPLPLTAAKGSTVVIPIGSGGTAQFGEGDKTGFGAPNASDPQRGRLRLWLDDGSNCSNVPTPEPSSRDLQVRAVTRVVADPATYAALDLGAQAGEQAGQVVVIADVAPSAPVGTFLVCIRRYTKSSWNGTEWVEQVAASPSYGAQLTVLSATGASTPFEANVGAWLPLETLGVQFDFTPLPRLRFAVSTPPDAGAVHVALTYPSDRAVVWSVLAEPLGESGTWSRGALVSFSEPTPGVLDIRALIPEGVNDPVFSIVFELTQPEAAPPIGGPLQTGNFVFSTVEAWDVSGAPVAASVSGKTIL